MLKIKNSYGNFDLAHNTLPKGYVFIRGKRLQPLARKKGIKFVPAVTSWAYSGYKKYGSKPQIGGIIVTAKQAQKMLLLVKAREERTVDPKVIAQKQRAKELRENRLTVRDNWLDEQAKRIGYLRGSHTERALLRGYIEEDEAELIAFKSFYRHTFTDYDQQYDRVNWHQLKSELGFEEAKRYMRDFAHESKVESPFPDNWSDYLSKYGFTSPEALAMASVLKDPKRSHPVWFKAREIGLRGRSLDGLTYEIIRDSV